jgi:hypothetical protein
MTTPADDPDVYAWTPAQAQTLPTTDGSLLDGAPLVDVIERIDMHETRARSRQWPRLLAPRLTWRDPPTHRTPSWRRTIRQARDTIVDVIDGSHSVHNDPAQRVPLAYRRARRDAADDTGLPLATFPEACPWPLAQVLNEDFWPEA